MAKLDCEIQTEKKRGEYGQTVFSKEAELEETRLINEQMAEHAKKKGEPTIKMNETPDFFDKTEEELEVEKSFDFGYMNGTDVLGKVNGTLEKPLIHKEQNAFVPKKEIEQSSPNHQFRVKRGLDFYKQNAPVTCLGLNHYLDKKNGSITTLTNVVEFVKSELKKNKATTKERQHECTSKGSKLTKIRDLIINA
jgi:hypothetical protein